MSGAARGAAGRGTMAGSEALERTLASDDLLVRLVADESPVVVELRDRRTGRALLHRPEPLVAFAPESTGPALIVDGAPDEIRLRWVAATGQVAAEAVVALDGPRLACRVDAPGMAVGFPFLDALFAGDALTAGERVIGGAAAFQDGRGRPIVRHVDWPLPAVRIGPDGRTLTRLADLDVGAVGTGSGAASLAPDPNRTELVVHDGGWPAAFDLFRQRVRARFDLAQYARPDLAWYRDQLVQHFTFLYGREILNLETGAFEIDRFLDEADETFGGYDGMLIWGVYPLIGVDERTQWDFHDDLPGGRSGVRAMARRARERGVRFFVPFKPWDVSAERHGRPADPPPAALAELARDVEADGIFLDTMSAVSPEFRAALDHARPGVVFCSEGRSKGLAFETITGSWDQSLYHDVDQGDWSAAEEAMPGVDLWRFVFPEHPLFVINRHAVGDDRLRIIRRGFFGGMGWVVWQDIFGLVLPYAPDEAALLKRCRTIAREHLSALRGPCPTPLVETIAPGVYANEFPGEGKRLWTLYNETDRPVTGAVLRVRPAVDRHLVDVWGDEEAAVDGEGRLHLTLGPGEVGAIAEVPRRLAYDRATDRVSVAAAPPGAVVERRRAGAAVSSPVADGPVDVAALVSDPREPLLVRLLADGELLDQIVLRPGARS